MANKKAAPEKRKYTKKSAHWRQGSSAEIKLKPKSNDRLLSFILEGVDRLNLADKALVFAHILGKDQLDEKQLWAVQKLLS